MMDAWFHAEMNQGRPVLDVRNPIAGETVCRFGMASGSALCGAILSTDVSVHYAAAGVTVNGLASAHMWSTRGDSGGPVYGGNTAMGLIAGTVYSGNTPVKTDDKRTYITKIKTAENLTGTCVCREPVCS